MNNGVNFVYDIENDSSDELKHWLFLENVRIQQEKQYITENNQKLIRERESFEREKMSHKSAMEIQEKRLCKQKELFEKKWQVVERELKRMAKEKEKIEKDMAILQKEKDQINKIKTQSVYSFDDARPFFRGVNSAISLKKRYRELLKMFHPDNETGDETTAMYITKEYNKLKKQYGID